MIATLLQGCKEINKRGQASKTKRDQALLEFSDNGLDSNYLASTLTRPDSNNLSFKDLTPVLFFSGTENRKNKFHTATAT